ncbi:MAG: sigma-70 family RNA polymerase sigma factor [candidate division WOR-3 bacterium]
MQKIDILNEKNNYRTLSDEELVRKASNNDPIAFETLIKRYEQKVYNLAYRITNNQQTANDILQETFTKVYKSLKNFKGKSKFSTWLYRIAFNFCLMHKRKKTRTVSFDTPIIGEDENEIPRDIPDWSSDPGANLENKEFTKTLDEAIQKLPDEYRDVVILRDMQGLSNTEVAKILNISIPAVKARIHRARMFLRDKLSAYFNHNYGKM